MGRGQQGGGGGGVGDEGGRGDVNIIGGFWIVDGWCLVCKGLVGFRNTV